MTRPDRRSTRPDDARADAATARGCGCDEQAPNVRELAERLALSRLKLLIRQASLLV
jgi:hypothetical protein